MLQYCLYLLYRTGVWLLNLLPLPALFFLGQISGAIAWFALPQYRRLAWRNVRIAFGEELPASQRRALVRRHFRRLGANLLCSIKFAHLPIERILERVQVENFHHLENCVRENKPLVLLLSHTGPWELCAHLLPHFIPERRKSTVYLRLRNRFIDQHVRETRARFGVEMFDRREGFASAIQLLREGGAIGVLADQHAGDSGLWTPFFGRIASTTPLPGLLVRRTGARLVAMAVHTNGFARWRATAYPPLEGDSVNWLTARGNQVIEQEVRRAPEDWFWVHDRWKTPTPNFLLTRYKRGVFLADSAALKPFRILIRSSNWLGDAAMSVPAVRAIKAGRPDGHVTIATPEKLAAMWKIVPAVDEVISFSGKSVLAAVRALRRAGDFDVAILFPNSFRSALEVFLARIPRRVGFGGHGRGWLLNQCPLATPARGIAHQIYRFLELASTVGADVKLDFPAARPAENRSEMRFGLCPGAEYGPTKRWLPERFIEVAAQIATEFRARWILFGSAADRDVGATIADALGDQCVNQIGQTSLEQLIGQLRECDLLLTNDTGTMHLAALLRVPTVSIFGSTEPRKTGPLGAGHRILRHHVECSPCFLRECPIDFRCMHAVTSAEVITTIRHLMTRPS
jgi:heptosyltransferase-2